MVANIIDYLTDYVTDIEGSRRELMVKAMKDPIEIGNNTREKMTEKALDVFITDMHRRIRQLIEFEKYNSDRHNIDYGTGFPSLKK